MSIRRLRGTRREFLLGAGASAAVTLTGPGGSPAAQAAQPAPRTWLLPRSAFGNLANTGLGGDPDLCRTVFNQGSTWFTTNYQGAGPSTKNPVPAGYTGVGVLKFQAYRNGSLGLLDALAAGLPPWVQAVQYDAEYWPGTPPLEQGAWLYNDYARCSCAQLFCETAHDHGLKVVLSPGNDLCNNHPNPAYPDSAPQYPVDTGEADHEAYVRYALASVAQWLAPGDLYEYQAQPLELDTATYRAITAEIAGQVRAAAPEAGYLAGIGRTGATWDQADCDQLTAAVASVADVVSGHWPNVDADATRVQPMICLLTSLG